MYLIFDTTGIGKPLDNEASYTNTRAWPRMIHIAWIILDKNLKPIGDFNYVIKPESYDLTEAIAKKAQLKLEDINERSVSLNEALHSFEHSLQDVTYVGAHNLSFNQNVLAAEFHRKEISNSLFDKESFCLMQESTFYCKLPSKTGGYKWPTLSEMHKIIFSKAYSPPNNARADVIAATRCFKALKMGGQLEDLFEED